MWQVRGQVLLTHLNQIGWGKKGEREEETETEREREKESFYSEKLSLLSRFFDDQSVKSRRGKRQS